MSRKEKYHLIIALSCCAAFGGAVLGFAARWGLGLSPDSAVYIGAARSLAKGSGFSLPTESGAFAPVVQYPPLYPALLVLLGLSGPDPVAAARWLNLLLFSMNIFLAGAIAFISNGSLRSSVLTSCLVATAFPVVLVHSMAWSEPLFMLCELCVISFLLSYFWKSDYRCLFAAAAATGLSILTRYAGLALATSGTAAVLITGATRWQKRVFNAAVFLAASLLPMGFWGARNVLVAGSATNRQIGFHPIGLDRVSEFVSTMLSWFWSSSIQMQILAVCVIVVGGFAVLLRVRRQCIGYERVESGRSMGTLYLMVLIIGNYLVLLVVSITFLDAQTPVDTRILSPLYVPFVLLSVSFFTWLARRDGKSDSFRMGLLASALIILGLQIPASLSWLNQLRHDGIGYSSRGWVDSEVVKQLTLLDSTISIFSNAPDVVYTLLGRPASMVPRKMYPESNLPNPDYNSQIEQMKRSLKSKNGLVVYFDRVRWRWYLPSAAELEKEVGLQLVIKTNDGSVYKFN